MDKNKRERARAYLSGGVTPKERREFEAERAGDPELDAIVLEVEREMTDFVVSREAVRHIAALAAQSVTDEEDDEDAVALRTQFDAAAERFVLWLDHAAGETTPLPQVGAWCVLHTKPGDAAIVCRLTSILPDPHTGHRAEVGGASWRLETETGELILSGSADAAGAFDIPHEVIAPYADAGGALVVRAWPSRLVEVGWFSRVETTTARAQALAAKRAGGEEEPAPWKRLLGGDYEGIPIVLEESGHAWRVRLEYGDRVEEFERNRTLVHVDVVAGEQREHVFFAPVLDRASREAVAEVNMAGVVEDLGPGLRFRRPERVFVDDLRALPRAERALVLEGLERSRDNQASWAKAITEAIEAIEEMEAVKDD